MRTTLRFSVVLACAIAAGGCAIRHMDVVPAASRVLQPPPGTSLVFIVRPEVWGGSDVAFLYDDEYYVGTLKKGEHIAYVTKPGRHLFVVTSEAADFLEADLLPDKTYYTRLRRRWGIGHERFTFVPSVDPAAIRETKAMVAKSPQMRVNAKGQEWNRGKHETMMRMKAKFLVKWDRREDRPDLPASAGE
jgi:hypothetical protein